jgi:hypothetical protein
MCTSAFIFPIRTSRGMNNANFANQNSGIRYLSWKRHKVSLFDSQVNNERYGRICLHSEMARIKEMVWSYFKIFY